MTELEKAVVLLEAISLMCDTAASEHDKLLAQFTGGDCVLLLSTGLVERLATSSYATVQSIASTIHANPYTHISPLLLESDVIVCSRASIDIGYRPYDIQKH